MTLTAHLRTALSVLTVALSACTSFTGSCVAEDYPGSRPIHIVVPYGPGASTDLLARAAADVTARKYGYTFVIESRPGAGTLLGTRLVKSAEPDGYTILFQVTNFLNNLHTLKDPGYRMEDFSVVGLLGQTGYVLIIPSNLPARISVDKVISCKRSKTSQLRMVPTMRKSLGPNIVSKISAPMPMKASVSSVGQGS